MVFPIVMYGCGSWTKSEHRGIYAFELRCWRSLLRVPRNLLDCKQIKLVNTKGNQPWIFVENTDNEAEAPIIFQPDAMKWIIGKDPNDLKDGWKEVKEMTEDEMVGWHHLVDGHEFEQAPGDGGGQGSLMCYSPWGLKELDMTEWLSLTEGMHMCYVHNIMIIWSLYIGHIEK